MGDCEDSEFRLRKLGLLSVMNRAQLVEQARCYGFDGACESTTSLRWLLAEIVVLDPEVPGWLEAIRTPGQAERPPAEVKGLDEEWLVGEMEPHPADLVDPTPVAEPEPTVAVWFWEAGNSWVELFDTEEEAANSVAGHEVWMNDSLVEAAQFADGRILEFGVGGVRGWPAYDECFPAVKARADEFREKSMGEPGPPERLVSLFGGKVRAWVPADYPDWVGS